MAIAKIFIDCGHGGKDSGAVGKVKEKDRTLQVGISLKDRLTKRGFEVMLSRDTDKFLELKERTDMANKWGADILISLHINDANPTGYGIETYTYTTKPANACKLARLVQWYLIARSGCKDRGVKSANFHMLRESKMTAILIEGGFIKTDDMDKLPADKYVDAVYCGVCEYYGVSREVPTPPKPTTPPVQECSKCKELQAKLDAIKKIL